MRDRKESLARGHSLCQIKNECIISGLLKEFSISSDPGMMCREDHDHRLL